jgi:hypothetical protein
MRARRLALSVRMPALSTRQLRMLLRSRCAEHHLSVELDMERQYCVRHKAVPDG